MSLPPTSPSSPSSRSASSPSSSGVTVHSSRTSSSDDGSSAADELSTTAPQDWRLDTNTDQHHRDIPISFPAEALTGNHESSTTPTTGAQGSLGLQTIVVTPGFVKHQAPVPAHGNLGATSPKSPAGGVFGTSHGTSPGTFPVTSTALHLPLSHSRILSTDEIVPLPLPLIDTDSQQRDPSVVGSCTRRRSVGERPSVISGECRVHRRYPTGVPSTRSHSFYTLPLIAKGVEPDSPVNSLLSVDELILARSQSFDRVPTDEDSHVGPPATVIDFPLDEYMHPGSPSSTGSSLGRSLLSQSPKAVQATTGPYAVGNYQSPGEPTFNVGRSESARPLSIRVRPSPRQQDDDQVQRQGDDVLTVVTKEGSRGESEMQTVGRRQTIPYAEHTVRMSETARDPFSCPYVPMRQHPEYPSSPSRSDVISARLDRDGMSVYDRDGMGCRFEELSKPFLNKMESGRALAPPGSLKKALHRLFNASSLKAAEGSPRDWQVEGDKIPQQSASLVGTHARVGTQSQFGQATADTSTGLGDTSLPSRVPASAAGQQHSDSGPGMPSPLQLGRENLFVPPFSIRSRLIVFLEIANGKCIRHCVQTPELLHLVHQDNKQRAIEDSLPGSLKLRDIRQICSQTHGSQRASIVLRRNCIVFNLLKVRCIILYQRLLLIPYGYGNDESTRSKLPNANVQVGLPSSTSGNSLHLDDGEYKDAESSLIKKLMSLTELKTTGLFEFVILETLLVEVCSYLKDELTPIVRHAESLHDFTVGSLSSAQRLHEISDLKRTVDSLSDRLKTVSEALQELLNNEEDLRRMEVTRFWHKPSQWESPSDSPASEDAEILLECYEQEIESMLRQVNRIDEELDDTLQMIQLHLATIRNTFLKSELGLDVIGTIVTFVAALAGIFGMNIPNGFEKNDSVFWPLCHSMLTLCLLTTVITVIVFRQIKL